VSKTALVTVVASAVLPIMWQEGKAISFGVKGQTHHVAVRSTEEGLVVGGQPHFIVASPR
jgi:hypothetical protein